VELGVAVGEAVGDAGADGELAGGSGEGADDATGGVAPHDTVVRATNAMATARFI
jgi:hypothetical protein